MSVGGVNNGFNIDPSYKKDTTNVNNINIKNVGKTGEIEKTKSINSSQKIEDINGVNKKLSTKTLDLDKGVSFNFVQGPFAMFAANIDLSKLFEPLAKEIYNACKDAHTH